MLLTLKTIPTCCQYSSVRQIRGQRWSERKGACVRWWIRTKGQDSEKGERVGTVIWYKIVMVLVLQTNNRGSISKHHQCLWLKKKKTLLQYRKEFLLRSGHCVHLCVFACAHMSACMCECGCVPVSPSACHLVSSLAVDKWVGSLMLCVPVAWLSGSPAGWRSLSSRSSWVSLQRSKPGTDGSAQATPWTRTPGCWRPMMTEKKQQQQRQTITWAKDNNGTLKPRRKSIDCDSWHDKRKRDFSTMKPQQKKKRTEHNRLEANGSKKERTAGKISQYCSQESHSSLNYPNNPMFVSTDFSFSFITKMEWVH